ncbi:hypothetical protein HW555_007638 [Spodoptera exigua]|uniref:Uncharacterized protein n=1 Tax=Spodoptera exigua TaxID=7107 RepID=A0A835GFL1_SPOEX|nr:hypothetical protein HW555_007638 [Spodoptera exigua]
MFDILNITPLVTEIRLTSRGVKDFVCSHCATVRGIERNVRFGFEVNECDFLFGERSPAAAVMHSHSDLLIIINGLKCESAGRGLYFYAETCTLVVRARLYTAKGAGSPPPATNTVRRYYHLAHFKTNNELPFIQNKDMPNEIYKDSIIHIVGDTNMRNALATRRKTSVRMYFIIWIH